MSINGPLWPRCEIALANGTVVVSFSPRTLAMIERESGLSSMEFAEKFSDPKRAPIFDLGLRIILGAVKAAVPGMTEELLSERIPPGEFIGILEIVAEKWAEGVSSAGSAISKAEAANPTRVGEVSPSST